MSMNLTGKVQRICRVVEAAGIFDNRTFLLACAGPVLWSPSLNWSAGIIHPGAMLNSRASAPVCPIRRIGGSGSANFSPNEGFPILFTDSTAMASMEVYGPFKMFDRAQTTQCIMSLLLTL